LNRHFYPRKAASAVLAVIVCPSAVCLSVRLFVTSRCSTKTAKHRITQTTPKIAQGLLFSDAENLGEIPKGTTPTRVPNRGGVSSNRPLLTNISL